MGKVTQGAYSSRSRLARQITPRSHSAVLTTEGQPKEAMSAVSHAKIVRHMNKNKNC